MVGIPGAGKTAFAERFANTFHAPFLNVRALQAGLGTDSETTQKAVTYFFSELLKTQKTFIFEGYLEAKADRLALVKSIKAAGYESLLVWVQTEPNEALRRATRRVNGKQLMDVDTFKDELRHFEGPVLAEKPVVISGKHTYTTQLKIVLKRLAGPAKPDQDKPEPPRAGRSRQVIIR
jgi:predicted kinase